MLRSLCVVAFLASGGGVRAATLINVSGPNDGTLASNVLSNAPAVGFMLPSAYNNVSLTVSLVSFGGSGTWNLEAFLTTQLGPGTTAASHEVASISQAVNAAGGPFGAPLNVVPLTVFSGLSLPAGTYYLMVGGTFNTQNLWWVSSPNGNVVTSTQGGAAIVAPNLFAGAQAAYLPASLIADGSTGVNGSNLWFTVTGDPVTAPSVPEPATYVTLCSALAAFGLYHRRVRKRY